MSFAATCAGELRQAITRLDRLTPTPTSAKNPHRYHEDKSEIRAQLVAVAMMLEGDFAILPPEAEAKKPEPGVKKAPYSIKTRKGNVVHVDFTVNRRRTPPPRG